MTRRRALWLLGITTLVLFAVLVVLDGRMQDTGGHGIVAFELACSSARAAEIMGEWGSDGRDAARASLWLDYLYLVAYGAFLWLAVRAVRDAALRRGWERFARPGAAIALLPLVAAAADARRGRLPAARARRPRRSAGPRLATALRLGQVRSA